MIIKPDYKPKITPLLSLKAGDHVVHRLKGLRRVKAVKEIGHFVTFILEGNGLWQEKTTFTAHELKRDGWAYFG